MQGQGQEVTSNSSITTTSPTLVYRQFIETCKNPSTRQTYVLALHHFMRYLGLDVSDYDKLLDKDTKLIQLDICNFITYIKKDHSSGAAST